MKSRIFILSALLLMISLPVAACELKVGWEEWKPYIYAEKGQLKGADYDYLMRLSDAIDCRLTFIELPWIHALEQMEQGKLDLLSGASLIESHKAYARFSLPYRREDIVLVTASGEKPRDINDWLSHNRVGLIRGFQYPEVLMDALDNMNPVRKTEADSDEQLLRALESGSRFDGYISERVIANYQRSQTRLPLSITSIPADDLEPLYFMLSKKIPQTVLTDINVAIETLSYYEE